MGMTLAQLAAEKQNEYKDEIILANVNGKLKELGEEYIPDSDVTFVTTSTSIGNETYRRSVVLLMLAAIDKIDRNIDRVVVEYSLSKGLYCTFDGDFRPDKEFIDEVKSVMHSMVEKDLPIKKELMKISDAMNLFKEKGMTALLINAKAGSGLKGIQAAVQEACKEKIERDRRRGIKNRPVRAMVVGIPNVGKSTFINAYAGRACAKTGNKPGVTKGKQWIRLGKNLELLDTPGILWPKFESQIIGRNIAFIGSMNDQIIQIEELALDLIGVLEDLYPGILKARYEAETPVKLQTEDRKAGMLYQICESRKCYKKGEEYDTEKAAALLLDDFRNGRLGRITLEQDLGGTEKS